MFSLRNKRRLMKKSVNLNKYGPFFIIFPLPIMLKFTVHITAVHLFTCVAKAVTSRRSREFVSRPLLVRVFSDVLVAFLYFDICHYRQSNLAIENPEFSQPVVAGHFQ